MSKGLLITIGIVALLFGSLVVASKGNHASSSPALSFATVQQDTAKGAKLYDVRTAEEFTTGHIDSSVNWPVEMIATGKMPDVAKDVKIYVYCESGSRSAQASGLLKNAGYTNVVDLGGLAHVEAMGGKLIK